MIKLELTPKEVELLESIVWLEKERAEDTWSDDYDADSAEEIKALFDKVDDLYCTWC